MSIITRLVTSEMIEYLIVLAAEALSRKTDNKYDDEIVAKVKEVLSRK